MAVAISAVAFTASITSSSADSSFSHNEAEFASNGGNILYLASAIALPYLSHEKDGESQGIRSVDALGTSLIFTEILKDATHEKRPDSNAHDSFPSGHTDAAFAVATVESRFYPKQAPYWFLGATAIGASRLQLDRHHLQDVLVGAALGYGTAEWELSQRHGQVLGPFITPEGSGLTVSFHL